MIDFAVFFVFKKYEKLKYALVFAFCLVVELCAAPVAALLVPLDAVASAHADPSGDGTVLVELLGVLLLDSERLEATHDEVCSWGFVFLKE